MKRADIAAIAVLAVLGVGGCTTGEHPTTGINGRATAINPSGTPRPGSACLTAPTTGEAAAIIDWVDFVQLGGVQYVARFDRQVPAVPMDQLGATVGLVTCRLSALKLDGPPSGPPVDGDAAFLDVGTQVRSIRGWDPACRVAARVDGVNRVYLAQAEVDGFAKVVPCATTSQGSPAVMTPLTPGTPGTPTS